MRIVRHDEQGPGQPGLVDAEGQTLAPVDLIIKGIPASVGMGVAPPEFLKPGDLVEMSITGVAAQGHAVIVS
jgi:2-keto-4-pentenoate hydratase/2-oxohepta-3-ene-1,7-dioic acid hydratase in catechol pathway